MQTSARSIGANRQFQAIVIGLLVIAIGWNLAGWIVDGSDQTLMMVGLSVIVGGIVLLILRDWRSGVLLFLLWLLFEDLVRKYTGNSMLVYFAKDFLIGIAYVSFYAAKHRRQVEIFKIPFLVPLGIFFGLALAQVFNPFSSSFMYGLLGLKIYFYYCPLMLLGYAMMDTPAQLERFLTVNLLAGLLIAGLGIAQAVLGVTFLTPDDIAPEFYSLTHTARASPVTHSLATVTSSVFVSAGRFSYYLIMLWILLTGAQGYLLASRRPTAKYGLIGIGVVTVAILTTGTRTPFVFILASLFLMPVAFLWGSPQNSEEKRRLSKALRRTLVVGAIAITLMAAVFPLVLGDRWRYLSETLSIGGEGSELQNRAWDYPAKNFEQALAHEHWLTGYGTGMNSLGMQYVANFLHEPVPDVGVESGYGGLIVEMGVLGPIAWLLWVSALLYASWKVVKRVRGTVYFPLAFAIWWYAVVLLLLLMVFGLQPYQNFVNSAFLWLLVGILFRLPKLSQMPQPVQARRRAGLSRWQLATSGWRHS